LADPKITGLTEQWTQEFAKSLQEKSGLPFEECYKYILRKPWLTLYHEPRIRQQPIQVGIYFAPTQDEVEQVYRPYGQEWYKSVGTVTVEAEITDDLLSLYYPAIYKISVEAVTELTSKETLAVHPSEIKRIFLFEGAISGYAFTGGRVRIRGMLQRVTSSENDGFYQILIGTTENHSREYIQLLDRNPRINSPLSL
jgi:predicted nucleotidyltransferase